MKAPRVSICVPTYNHGSFLGSAIESALSQTFADLEVVVSDNRSTDATRQVVERLARRDARIRYSLAEHHLPMHENFNRCAMLARGSYLKYLCADDVLEPRCVERMLTSLEANVDAKLVACARRLFGSAGPDRVLRYAATEVSCPGEQAIRKCYFQGNLIGEPTAVMFRSSDFRQGFSARFAQIIDLEMWFRLLEGGRFVFIPEILCGIREHERQATQAGIASGRVSADKELLYVEFSGKPYLAGTFAERLLWDFRMAWSMQRERAAGHARDATRAIYFPGLSVPMRAAAAAAWRVAGRT